MTRKEAIKIINEHFPPDSDYAGTARKGQRLLEQAKSNIDYIDPHWTELPSKVLFEFARLCSSQP